MRACSVPTEAAQACLDGSTNNGGTCTKSCGGTGPGYTTFGTCCSSTYRYFESSCDGSAVCMRGACTPCGGAGQNCCQGSMLTVDPNGVRYRCTAGLACTTVATSSPDWSDFGRTGKCAVPNGASGSPCNWLASQLCNDGLGCAGSTSTQVRAHETSTDKH
jgi:hypothetical protein